MLFVQIKSVWYIVSNPRTLYRIPRKLEIIIWYWTHLPNGKWAYVWNLVSSYLTHFLWIKWAPFHRRHFQMHFREWKLLYFEHINCTRCYHSATRISNGYTWGLNTNCHHEAKDSTKYVHTCVLMWSYHISSGSYSLILVGFAIWIMLQSLFTIFCVPVSVKQHWWYGTIYPETLTNQDNLWT